ncbi:MAG TPA: N-acetylglucosamine-6-phosphate deacetylase [Urbifossiella sp.]|nr:N-acetylglucosamine-6-phosphate deacetylase [Urbifossiella sp.]
MSLTVFANATVVLPDRLESASVTINGERIVAVGATPAGSHRAIDLKGKYLAPGFVDLHVHGGDGADFMDGTAEAFATVCRCHARHGTTSLTPTSTVARMSDYERFLELCELMYLASGGRQPPDSQCDSRGATIALKNQGADAPRSPTGSRIVGSHFYGPYFARPARGCHPDQDFLVPDASNSASLMRLAGTMPFVVTVAPEIDNAEWLVRTYAERGVRFNAGHSFATFSQMEAAVKWGVRHVDHLFCAMSDRARLRQSQTFPMRGGVMEATLFFDELTTEVIADGKHLTPELLRLAYKIKGPDKLALVTDSMRAVDLPDGEYWFGPEGRGEMVRKMQGVGVTLEGTALASGVMGMDHCVRTMHRGAGVPLPETIRMASLTPARILGIEKDVGSIAAGKVADLAVLDAELNVEQVYIEGQKVEV